jgi:hypothetical protein
MNSTQINTPPHKGSCRDIDRVMEGLSEVSGSKVARERRGAKQRGGGRDEERREKTRDAWRGRAKRSEKGERA